MSEQTLIPGTETPLLVSMASVDPGLTDGYIVRNLPDGTLEHRKMPVDEDGGLDLTGVETLLLGYDVVILEHVPLKVRGPTNLTENCVWGQYMQIYGLLWNKIPFITVRPEGSDGWMAFFNFPKKGNTPTKDWKWFIHSQACQRFPTVKKMPKEAGAAYMLYRYLTMTYEA